MLGIKMKVTYTREFKLEMLRSRPNNYNIYMHRKTRPYRPMHHKYQFSISQAQKVGATSY